jgi:hypothetical protein
MSQVTIYLSDELAASLRRDARRARKSLSAYVAELASKKPGKGRGRPQGFEALYGSCRGELPEVDDPPPDEPAAA